MSVDPYPEQANIVYRFGVHLKGTDPPIWRLIDVPAEYRFWDLHVAIQDAMGWLDYHLHEFSIIPPDSRKPVTIGIPASDFGYENDDVLRDSECAIADYFRSPGDKATYIYDFGDGWQHEMALSKMLPSRAGSKVPGVPRRRASMSAGGLRRRRRLPQIPWNPRRSGPQGAQRHADVADRSRRPVPSLRSGRLRSRHGRVR